MIVEIITGIAIAALASWVGYRSGYAHGWRDCVDYSLKLDACAECGGSMRGPFHERSCSMMPARLAAPSVRFDRARQLLDQQFGTDNAVVNEERRRNPMVAVVYDCAVRALAGEMPGASAAVRSDDLIRMLDDPRIAAAVRVPSEEGLEPLKPHMIAGVAFDPNSGRRVPGEKAEITVPLGKITQLEIYELFGPEMPTAAIEVLMNGDKPDWSADRIRRELRRIAEEG